MFDYHFHSDYSQDGHGTMRDYCVAAKKKKLKEICVTNHFCFYDGVHMNYFDGPATYGLFRGTMDDMMEEYEETHDEFPFLRIGLEFDYRRDVERDVERVLKEYPLDYSLGSVHLLGNMCITSRKKLPLYLAEHTLEETYANYFAEVAKAAETGLFDCLAHLDVIRRYSPPFDFPEWRESAVRALEAAKENKIALELNTNPKGLAEGLTPLPWLREAKALGFDSLVFGSDSHKPEDVGNVIADGMALAKKEGFKNALSFTKRKQTKVKL
ncbi:phosphatase YcdX [Candidatus Norongarragalina meridionalis]|nr:phosphatase YcdX [Candidatus Norongarragalina meridionalis]